MVRSLARVYYYFVFNAMLILAAVGLGLFLGVMLRYTPLGDGTLPSSADVKQVSVFAGVAWLIAATLGGLHYWLIRRDLAIDPGAGSGGVRSFFLNATEFVAGWEGVGFAVGAITNLGFKFAPNSSSQDYYYSNTYQSGLVIGLTSAAVATLFVVVVLELERRRTQVAPGAPIVFQRLHFYILQLVVLGYAMVTLGLAIAATVSQILVTAGQYDPCGGAPSVGFSARFGAPGCGIYYNLGGEWPAAVFAALAFFVYWRLAGRDSGSILRQVSQLLGLASGVVVAAIGTGIALNFALRTSLGEAASWQAFVESNDFLPTLLVGLLAAGVYGLWLRQERDTSRMGAQATDLSIQAVVAVVFAAPFWFGAGWLLYRVIEITTNSSFHPDALGWAGPLAFFLTGVVYIPVALVLRRQTQVTGVQGPRRAFVLALLAAGTIVGAIGAAVTLYSGLTGVLGVPVDASGEATRVGVTLLLTGLALAGLYGWSAVSEHLVGQRTTQAAPAVGAFPQAATPWAPAVGGSMDQGVSVEAVLDELLAGQLTHEQAASRVREAARAGR